MKLEEGKLIEIEGQEFLVDSVEYSVTATCYGYWIKEVTLKGVKPNDK